MATGKVRPTRPTSTGFKHCSLRDHLGKLSPTRQLEMLSCDLVRFSTYVWRKRLRLQWSIMLAMPAGLLLLLAHYLTS
jgi:hypothetical protein